MIVLVINSGSSSLKYQVFDMAGEHLLAKGLVDRIGLPGAKLIHQHLGKDKVTLDQEPIPDHHTAISMTLKILQDEQQGVIQDLDEIAAIGHRVAHGGDRYDRSVLIDEDVLADIEYLGRLAPLHNPPILLGIRACKRILPEAIQVAVFDTAFHQTVPPEAYLYAIPHEMHEKYHLRRYGFHGTSHLFVAKRAASVLNRPLAELRLITCHLGNGASITAIRGGQSIDTSMGFTPLEGLVMGTRVGDLDPGVIPYLMEQEKWSVQEVNSFLNKRCGVLGLSGVSSDFRDLEEAAKAGNRRAAQTLDVFAYRVKKYIGAYAAALSGVDAVIFTGGLGENSPEMRARCARGLEFLGLPLDEEKNQQARGEADITADGASGKLLVIPTNEELMIARDTCRLLGTRG